MMQRLTLMILAVCCAAGLSACGGGSVAPPGPNPDFTLQANPGTITATPGSNSTATSIAVSGLNGFSGNVIVTVTGLPPGASTAPAIPFAVAASSSQMFTVFVPSTVAPGNIALTITGTSGLRNHAAALVLSVGSNPAPDFSLSVSPASIAATSGGSSNAATVSVAGSNGFSGNVSVTLTGLPAGATTTPAQPFSVAAGAAQQVVINVPPGVAAGSYSLTVSGTSGTLAHTASLVLNVNSMGSDQLVVIGHTDSSDFPTTPGALAPAPPGGADNGFVSSVRLTGGTVGNTFSTYFGGNGEEQIRDVFVDSQGNIYITGQTTSTDIPALLPPAATAGVWGASCNACATQPDAFLAKFDPTGQALRFTYLGGTGHDEGYNLFVDSAGTVYVGGRTSSTDFPVTGAQIPQRVYGGGTYDMHVTKLSADFSTILWATYLGGSDEDTGRGRLQVDGSGNVYMGGATRSTNFPGAVGLLSGFRDGVVVKLSPGGALLYTRLIGGNDAVNEPEGMTGGLLVKSSGEVYACGFSAAPNVPNAIRPFGGGTDALLVRLDPAGQILATTYLGGNGPEECQGIALDAAGNLVVATVSGSTSGFPITAGAFQASLAGGNDFAITKFSPDLSTILFSTFAGGAGNEAGDTLKVGIDPSGNIYFAGHTASVGIPWITSNAMQPAYGGGSRDILVFVLSADGSRIIYASYLGGNGQDICRGLSYRRNP